MSHLITILNQINIMALYITALYIAVKSQIADGIVSRLI